MSRQDGKTGSGSTMVTSSGYEVRLRGVSIVVLEAIKDRIERELREEGKPIDPPKITIDAAGGETDEQVITAQMIEKNPKLAEEFGDEWLAHVAAQRELSLLSGAEASRYMFLDGVVLTEEAETEFEADEWADRQTRFSRIEAPSDPEERMFWFLRTMVFPTQEDQVEANTRLQALTYATLDEEMVASAKRLFRSEVRRAVGDAFGGPAEETEPVVPQRAADAGGGGTSLGDEAN